MAKFQLSYPSSDFLFHGYKTTMAQFQPPTGAAECSKCIEERNNMTVVLSVGSGPGQC